MEQEQEDLNYANNLKSFIDKMKNAYVDRISFNLDLNPTFDVKLVPFRCKYCYTISIVTDSEIFYIRTTMNSSGIETFWITSIPEIIHPSHYKEVDSSVKSIEVRTDHNNYAYRIKIGFQKNEIIFYAGEIYDEGPEKLRYTVQDEMILLFEEESEAVIFEKLLAKRTKIN